MQTINQFIYISASQQRMHCFENDTAYKIYPISTGENGLGEQNGSGCTPRGWHQIYSRIGLDVPINTVFVSREPTGELYSSMLASKYPKRDWILTRILQLDGLEEGRNRGGEVDSLRRYIYIHGTPDTIELGKPASHGCIRMRNVDVIELAEWVTIGTRVYIE
ncbi:putative ErfK/YbiS/YcfS/YnhG protein [Legionella brunensis]|uniref:Putative ErfK/YbiS/YcfS/YnhG protein n=2 Tax=Legionella brunensis TaxID=29422 RepID=A0A0W0STI3_9GAMM|nr:putative ErfK/YbiS/YcfS/YnhG protein [Legionella brunensis]